MPIMTCVQSKNMKILTLLELACERLSEICFSVWGGGFNILYPNMCLFFVFFLHRTLMSQMAYDLSLCPSICLITGDTAM